MKEYTGVSAKNYGQGNQRVIIANPGVERMIPKAKSNKNLALDLACGNGHFYPHLIEKGYKYHGVDTSKDLIDQAKQRFPEGNFETGDATELKGIVNKKYDFVLCVLMFNVLESKDSMGKVLEAISKILEENGTFTVCNVHPSFDPYMQKGLLNRKDVDSNFETYFHSPKKYVVRKETDNGVFVFEDYHYTFADFINLASEHNLYVDKLDECKPDETKRHLDPEYYDRKKYYPAFYVANLRLKS